MKVALIGASGFVGKAVLNELLQREYQVTGIVLRPEDIEPRDGLAVVQGDATDVDVLADAIKRNDTIISVFNAGLGPVKGQLCRFYSDAVKGKFGGFSITQKLYA